MKAERSKPELVDDICASFHHAAVRFQAGIHSAVSEEIDPNLALA